MPVAPFNPIPLTVFQNKKAIPTVGGVTFSTQLALLPVSTERWQIMGLKLAFKITYFHDGVYKNPTAFHHLVEAEAAAVEATEAWRRAQEKAATEKEGLELLGQRASANAEVRKLEQELSSYGFDQASAFFAEPAYTIVAALYRAGELVWIGRPDPLRLTTGPIEFEPVEAHSIMRAETELVENDLIQFSGGPFTLMERQHLELRVTVFAPPNELAEIPTPGGGVAVGFSSSFELGETGVNYSPEVQG